MKKYLYLLAIALILSLAGSCSEKSNESKSDNESTEVSMSKPEMDQQAIKDSIEAAARDSLKAEKVEEAQADKAEEAEEAELAKIAKDVDEYCDGIQKFIDNEVPCTSSAAYRFQSSQIASKIEKYKRQGRLTPEQEEQIDSYEEEWNNL